MLLSHSPLSLWQAGLFCFTLIFPTYAFVDLSPRADGDDSCINIASTDDGPTTDKSPGLGIEIETAQIQLGSDCNEDDTFSSKGKVVGNREGNNWKLTADTTLDAGVLTLEYILDGTQIKLGSGNAAKAADAVAKDLTDWKPDMGNQLSVDDSNCNPCEIRVMPEGGLDEIFWAMQATAPLPLEGINDLFSKILSNSDSDLLGSHSLANQVSVTSEFFQSTPNGISSESVKPDLMGFFSLVLSYAKRAQHMPKNESPKSLTQIMPRTDFTNLYSLVKSSVSGSLYDLVKVLACYHNEDGGVAIDSEYCDGTPDAPNPKNTFDTKEFSASSGDNKDSCTVKEWIESIENGNSPDRLSKIDQLIDKSIGGLGDATETIQNGDRPLGLFEFRRLRRVSMADLSDRINKVEQAVLDYHKQAGSSQRFVKKRKVSEYSHIKRQGVSASCAQATTTATTAMNSTTIATTSTPATTTAAEFSCYYQEEAPDLGINTDGCICGTSTIPVLNITGSLYDESSLCAYTAMPSASATNPITIATNWFYSNCYNCADVGGWAGDATCIQISGCTPTSTAASPQKTVLISDRTMPLGNANSINNGSDLRNNLRDAIKSLCPEDGHKCDENTTKTFMDEVPVIIDEGIEYMELTVAVTVGIYENSTMLDRLIAAGIATWQSAVSRSCQDEAYKADADATASGCGKGPLEKRSLPSRKDLGPRSPIGYGGTSLPQEECKYTANVCAGPTRIEPEFVGEQSDFANQLTIELDQKLEGSGSAFDAVDCEAIVGGLSALAMALAPEIAPADIMEGVEFESFCDGLADADFGLP